MRQLLPALTILLAACGSAGLPGPAMPSPLVPATPAEVTEWVTATERQEPERVRFRWDFLQDGAGAKGRGSALIFPPDSLRFDFAGPFGSNRSAAAVIGDRALWADPEERVQELVPNYQLLWAMLGQARQPDPGSLVQSYTDTGITAWRAVVGSDTVDYMMTDSPRALKVDVRLGDRRLGVVYTTFDSVGKLLKSRLQVPSGPARLDLEFYDIGPIDTLPPDIWVKPGNNAP